MTADVPVNRPARLTDEELSSFTASATILVVDDEESIRFTFDTFLSKVGYTVLSAGRMTTAKQLMDDNDIDLIFCDIVLPEGSGIELLGRARQTEKDCPVVMITGQPAIETAAAAVRAGAYDYLVKPIRKDDLLRITAKALAQRVLEVERRRIQEENERHRRHLEAIFSSVQDAIITVDTVGRIIDVNRAVERICGTAAIELLHQPMAAVDNPCLQRCFESATAILAGGDSIRQRHPTADHHHSRIDRLDGPVGLCQQLGVGLRVNMAHAARLIPQVLLVPNLYGLHLAPVAFGHLRHKLGIVNRIRGQPLNASIVVGGPGPVRCL